MEMRNILARNVRGMMQLSEISSQAELSRLSGISYTQIENILHSREAASIDLVAKLAEAFKCHSWQLLVTNNYVDSKVDGELADMFGLISQLSAKDSKLIREMVWTYYLLAKNAKDKFDLHI